MLSSFMSTLTLAKQIDGFFYSMPWELKHIDVSMWVDWITTLCCVVVSLIMTVNIPLYLGIHKVWQWIGNSSIFTILVMFVKIFYEKLWYKGISCFFSEIIFNIVFSLFLIFIMKCTWYLYYMGCEKWNWHIYISILSHTSIAVRHISW